MFKKISCAIIAAALLVSMTACGAGEGTTPDDSDSSQIVSNAAETISVRDTTGKLIQIEKPLKRVASYNSGLYNCMIALGVEDALVGCASSFDIAGTVTDVGAWNEPNIEVLLEVAPDAVFAYKSYMSAENEKILEDAGIKCIYLEMTDADTITSEYEALAKLFGKEAEAKEYLDLHAKYTKLLEDRVGDMKESDRKTIYYEGYTDYKSVNKTTGGHQLVTSAGGINIAAEEEAAYPEISDEWLLEQDPDMILKLISSTKKDVLGAEVTSDEQVELTYVNLVGRPGWADLQAVENDKVLIMHADISTNALGSIVGSIYMAKTLYPEKFEDIDPAQVHEEIYEALYGEELEGIWAYQPTK